MNWSNVAVQGRTERGAALFFALSPRDRAVVELVSQFSQLSARHIAAVLFADVSSKTPCDRTLKRLTERGLLARLPLRIVGGATGGATHYIYQLGREGWRLLGREGNYWQPRAVNPHSLAIADCFVALKAAERGGGLEVLGFDVEQKAYREAGGVKLTPDAYARVGLTSSRRLLHVWLEVDMGTERAAQILEKCARYWRAYEKWDGDVYPRVLFVAPDEARKRQLARMLDNAKPEQAGALFKTCTLADFPQAVA